MAGLLVRAGVAMTGSTGHGTAETTGGSLVVADLQRRGVDTVFGLPGVQLDGLFDALAATPGMRVVHPRHEHATSYMAYGYAVATGRVGVCSVVPGPGVLNAGAGLATAYACHAPVLLVAGDLFGGDAARGTGALHEIPDQSAVIAGTIGATSPIRAAGEIGPAVDAAFARLNGWPIRPAAIEVGPDVLLTPTDVSLGEPAVAPDPPRAPADAVAAAAAAVAGAARPVVVAGGGAIGAGPGLVELAEALAAPVILTAQGKGAISADRPDVLPQAASFTLLDEADAVIVIGSRFQTNAGPVTVSPDAVVVRIDADETRLAAPRPEGGELHTLHSDAGPAASALAAAVADVRPVDAERDGLHRARVGELRAAIVAGLAQRFPDTWAYNRVLRDALVDDAVLVSEMTQVSYVGRNAYPVRDPGTYIASGFQGTLGFGYPTALGVKVGCPDRTVVSVNGDGGFMYNLGELATAVHHDIGVVAVVFVDGAFGNVLGIQQRVYGREIASRLTNPDLVAVARGFGIEGRRAETSDELAAALGDLIAAGEPALIEVPMSPQPDAWAVLMGVDRL